MKKIVSFVPVYVFFFFGKMLEKLSYMFDSIGFIMTEMALYHIYVNLYWLSYSIQMYGGLNKPFNI